MISQEDFSVISRLDSGDQASRDKVAKEVPQQCAKTLYNLLGHISKDQTVQYLLTLVDDFLQEDKARVAIFRDYSRKRKESVWAAFLNLLNRPDGFIQNMTSRVVAKMACWSPEQMQGSDLQYYLTWLKDQLRMTGNEYVQSVARCLQMMLRIDNYRQVPSKKFFHFADVLRIVCFTESSNRLSWQWTELALSCLSSLAG